jgi:hypothetical protein
MTYTSQYDVFAVRAGYVDISAALSDQPLAQGAALSPVAVNDAASNKLTCCSG